MAIIYHVMNKTLYMIHYCIIYYKVNTKYMMRKDSVASLLSQSCKKWWSCKAVVYKKCFSKAEYSG